MMKVEWLVWGMLEVTDMPKKHQTAAIISKSTLTVKGKLNGSPDM